MINLRLRLNPGLLHFSQGNAPNFADTTIRETVSDVFIFAFYSILGVVRRGLGSVRVVRGPGP